MNYGLKAIYAKVEEYSRSCAESWLKYIKPAYFDECQGHRSGPAIIIPCGNHDVEIPYKEVVLLQASISDNPTLLSDFLNLIHDGNPPSKPKKRTSNTAPILRRSSK
jgi:hypothetical protein|tara:strand:+ start:6013 stop:6333 length:321 start_codon:yes stop_codon:yes gene_type:complete